MRELIPLEEAERRAAGAFGGFGGDPPTGIPASSLPEPEPLPDGLLPVAPFDLDCLPDSIGSWVADIADRMQCPLDFIGVPAIIALGSVIGRKIGVRPQRFTDWIEVPNLWGCIVGRPGAMKSPALQQALTPLHRLETEARKENEAAAQKYSVELETYKLRKEDAARKARISLKGGGAVGTLRSVAAPEEPKAKRYVANDATYESLGVILSDNPNGVLAFRDELTSLLKTLDREEFAAARGFFLSAWNGTSGYTFDRIVRGVTHIEAACLSLLGSTQPARISEYIRRAISGSVGDDGLIQRFSLLVWPDESPDWKDVDRYPNSAAREAAWSTFNRLSVFGPNDVGAERDTFEAIPFLRFDEKALGVFAEWRSNLERCLRSGELGSALESHLAKYRKLVPSIALITHLADGGSGPITDWAVLRAVAFADYLQTHARRAYAAGGQVQLAAAKAILRRIRKSDVSMPFTARDIHRRGWSGLTDIEQVQLGLDPLAHLNWLLCEKVATGGRPRFSAPSNFSRKKLRKNG
jgi:putative DNA primase/helicase